jgi:myosin heavy subunit
MVRFFNSSSSRPEWVQRVLSALRPHKVLFAVAAGFALQWSAVHFTVSVPLQRKIAGMERQVAVANEQMSALAALRGSAHQGHDLLSALQAQRESLASAEQALADIRKLRMDLEREARLTGTASTQLARVGELQRQVADAGQQATDLTPVMDRLTQLNERISSLAAPAETSLTHVDEAERALSLVNELQQRLSAQNASLPAALSTAEAAMSLQQSLANVGQSSTAAEEQSARLIELARGLNTLDPQSLTAASERAKELTAMQDLLADTEALRMKQAESNLRTLLGSHAQLLRATPEIAAAAENLELLTAFQAELNTQIEGLESAQQDLHNVAMLRDTIGRVADAVRPLAELSDLRRLDADQVRAMAREILERRTAQVLATDKPTEMIGPSSPLRTSGEEILVPDPTEP